MNGVVSSHKKALRHHICNNNLLLMSNECIKESHSIFRFRSSLFFDQQTNCSGSTDESPEDDSAFKYKKHEQLN